MWFYRENKAPSKLGPPSPPLDRENFSFLVMASLTNAIHALPDYLTTLGDQPLATPRTRVQDGLSDGVSNLGQTELVLHCCRLPPPVNTAANSG